MTGTFEEVVVPERLVVTAVAKDIHGTPLIKGLITATFEDLGGKTKLTVTEKAVGLAPVAGEMLGRMETGWAQSLVRLGTLVSRAG
jgi:uncharacterized protein YndB with AHSA1/START domain